MEILACNYTSDRVLDGTDKGRANLGYSVGAVYAGAGRWALYLCLGTPERETVIGHLYRRGRGQR